MNVGYRGRTGNTDCEHGLSGHYSLSGTLSRMTTPGKYRFMLLDKERRSVYRMGWSADNGQYTVTHLANRSGKWMLVVVDHNMSPKNCKGSDQLTLVRML